MGPPSAAASRSAGCSVAVSLGRAQRRANPLCTVAPSPQRRRCTVRTCAAASSTDTASGAAVGFSFTDRQYQWGQGRSCHYTELDGTTATDDTAPLVFLPGFGVGTFHFEAVMEAMQQQGVSRRVYALDWFGQGQSWPTADPAPSANPSTETGFEWGFGPEAAAPYKDLVYSLDNWTEQLEHFLQTQLNGKAVLAGNSLGGLVAANLTAKRPELVEALVFLNATPFWGFNKPWLPVWKGQLPVPKSIQAIAALWWNSIRTTETITQLLDFVYVDRQWDKSVIKSIQAPTRAPGSAAAFCSILFAPPTAMPFEQMLKLIRAAGTPVLLCYGRDDPWVVPAWGQKAKRDLGDRCIYYEVTPSGHCPHHETPEPVAFIVCEFLDALSAQQADSRPDPAALLAAMPSEEVRFGERGLTLCPRGKGSPRNVFEKVAYGVYCIERYVLRIRE